MVHDVVEQTSVAQAMLGLRAHTCPSGEGSIILATLILQLEQFRLQVTFSVGRCQVETAVDNQPSNSSECSHLQRRDRGICSSLALHGGRRRGKESTEKHEIC